MGTARSKGPWRYEGAQKKDAIMAKLATLERDWTTYIPEPTPV